MSEQSGEKIGIGIDGTIAGTTDTTQQDREPRDPTGLDNRSYTCTQTNFDTGLRYQKLDQRGPSSKTSRARIRDAIIRAQALNRIMIGWNGTSRAATSKPDINKLLQDVNVGWLQKMRLENPARVMKVVVGGSGKIQIGAGKDFENIDALVVSINNEFIEPGYREDTDLVVILNASCWPTRLPDHQQNPRRPKCLRPISPQPEAHRQPAGGASASLPAERPAGYPPRQPVDLLAGRHPPPHGGG